MSTKIKKEEKLNSLKATEVIKNVVQNQSVCNCDKKEQVSQTNVSKVSLTRCVDDYAMLSCELFDRIEDLLILLEPVLVKKMTMDLSRIDVKDNVVCSNLTKRMIQENDYLKKNIDLLDEIAKNLGV